MRNLTKLLCIGAAFTIAGCDADRDDKLGDMPEGGGSYEAPDNPTPADDNTSVEPETGSVSESGAPGPISESQQSE